MGKTKHFTKHVFKNETLDVRKVKKKKHFCLFFVSSYVSLYLLHHYSGE